MRTFAVLEFNYNFPYLILFYHSGSDVKVLFHWQFDQHNGTLLGGPGGQSISTSHFVPLALRIRISGDQWGLLSQFQSAVTSLDTAQ